MHGRLSETPTAATGVRITVASPARTAPGASRLPGGVGFDWAVALLSAVFVGGLFLDGWAHNHGKVDQSFFTPWHAVFYAGFAALASILVASFLRARSQGFPLQSAWPPGYGLSLLGVLVFAVGGVADMVWHMVFGAEQNVEALLSPTHLALALGAGLMVSGPVRAAWQRPDPASGWTARAPMLLALTCTLSLLTFFTMYAHPLVYPAAGGNHYHLGAEGMGVTAILLQTTLLMGMMLFVVRVWTLPAGSLTLVVTLNSAAMGVLSPNGGYPLPLVIAAGVAGVVADLAYARLRPTPGRPVAWRLFAFGVPAVFYLAHFLALMLTEGVAWSVHVWAGSIVLAGIAGWLLSYLVVPPAHPEAAHRGP